MSPDFTNDSDCNQQRCSVCRAVSPVTQTNYTLISPKHQWRMEIRTMEDGSKEPMWYCPDCWSAMKRSRAASKTRREQ